jgi:hypothetical protein
VTTTSHDHDFPVPPGYRDPEGRQVDDALLGQLVGAAWDGCGPCQAQHLAALAEDHASTAHLVELACVGTMAAVGGLPRDMTDDEAPGMASPEFRRLARAGVGGRNEWMFRESAQMPVAERLRAANSALDIIVGYMALGGPLS